MKYSLEEECQWKRELIKGLWQIFGDGGLYQLLEENIQGMKSSIGGVEAVDLLKMKAGFWKRKRVSEANAGIGRLVKFSSWKQASGYRGDIQELKANIKGPLESSSHPLDFRLHHQKSEPCLCILMFASTLRIMPRHH